MVNHLHIRNYKSIREIELEAKKVNVFIGEHNSGKSNILEALSWFSVNALDKDVFKNIFRFKNASDFFFDFNTSGPIEVKTDKLSMHIRYAENESGVKLDYFDVLISEKDITDLNGVKRNDLTNDPGMISNKLRHDGINEVTKGIMTSPFRVYQFKRTNTFVNDFRPFLSPPFGENLASLIISNRELKELVSSLFKEKGFRLMLKPAEGDISMAKDVNDELYAYPYPTLSETLQRIIFYSLAIESNQNAILILDEPDSNTFPMYTKQMAESIALDNSNQYFIATHNPYLLGSLISKAPTQDLAVFVTKMEQFETKVKRVSDNGLSEMLDSGVDLFFNLDKLAIIE